MRDCILDPIPEILDAARYLDAAVSAHLEGKRELAAELIKCADIPAIRLWTEALWGKKHVLFPASKEAAASVELIPAKERMPSAAQEREVILRDGYHCRYCGIPVIRPEVRDRIRKSYPSELRWGRKNIEQHTAFQAMYLQFDHLSAHSRGGANDPGNIVVACAPCNCARMENTVEEVGIRNPLTHGPVRSSWDGLERFR